MRPTLLVDGDIFLYQAAAASEFPVDWGDDHWTLHADLKKAKSILTVELDELRERFKPKRMVFALSDKENWRKRFFSDYKANRKGKRKPVCYVGLKNWACDQEGVEAISITGLEADDVIGIMATSHLADGDNRIVVSEDKDMKTLPCVLFNPAKSDDPVRVTKEEADLNHFTQALMGDTTDGYPGCPGVGKVKAKKILDGKEPSEMWSAVEAAYLAANKTKAFAKQMAVMARILRWGDMDLRTGELLWNPSSN